MFKRSLENHLPQSSFFLFGPRQVGKSTLLKTLNADLTIDLLNPESQLTYNKNPNLLLQQADALPKSSTIIIDEVQKVPRLLDVIHSRIEQDPSLRFVLCGSSARKLRHGSSNLLGGRAVYRSMHPLTMNELGNHFRLPLVLHYGSMPKIYTLLLENKIDQARDLLRAYTVAYLNEEIKAEALVRNLNGFQNFLDIAAAQFAEQINFSSVSRECQVSLSTVREYYSILEDTLIGFFLSPYLKSLRKRMSHSPKFYFFDNGVTRSILGTLRDENNSIQQGRLFEQWIVQELMRLNEYHQLDWKFNFWRTSHGAEVDLLISRGASMLYAVECKSTPHVSKSDLTGLKSFHLEYPKVPCYLVCPVEHPRVLDFVRVVSPRDLITTLQNADH
jgi:predicted AAA+ superfamily ATPase